MNPSVASLICACGVAALLYLDRDKTARVSWALWIPGLWIGIAGSRPVSLWLGLSLPTNAQSEGSPVDAAVLGLLLAAAIAVLIHRRSRIRPLLAANWPLLIYFLYCLISVAWSYHPDIAFKRWIKAIGDLAIPLVIVTEAQPVVALRRMVSAIGMLLLPISVLFIRYYPVLGRGYTTDGLLVNYGVTTNKNSLGLIVLVISLVVLWNVRSLLVHKEQANRGKRLLAQGTLLAFAIALLVMADCSTCKACFFIGGFLILVLSRRAFAMRAARVHALCLAIISISAAALFLGTNDVASALGRQSSMSGRTDIWAVVIPLVPNAVVGAGFESFWISPSAELFRQDMSRLGWYAGLVKILNEAHNGYIEVYLNLGWIGVCLIALVIISGYRRAVKALATDAELGCLFISFIVLSVFYSVTEAGFRMLGPAWIFLVLAIVSSSGVTAGFMRSEPFRIRKASIPPVGRIFGFGALGAESGTVAHGTPLNGPAHKIALRQKMVTTVPAGRRPSPEW
jgi:exopolysaccharide production protein ExoQ